MQQADLPGEILLLTRLIEADQAALKLPTVSQADKARLLLAIEQRAARLAILRDQLAVIQSSSP